MVFAVPFVGFKFYFVCFKYNIIYNNSIFSRIWRLAVACLKVISKYLCYLSLTTVSSDPLIHQVHYSAPRSTTATQNTVPYRQVTTVSSLINISIIWIKNNSQLRITTVHPGEIKCFLGSLQHGHLVSMLSYSQLFCGNTYRVVAYQYQTIRKGKAGQ